MKPIVVVTGKNGQLGWELQQLASSLYNEFHFIFTDRELLDLSKPASIAPFFEQTHPAYFINGAAYTAVDKAESEKEVALAINGTVVGEIATCCEKYHCKLITISTDYVFDGNGNSPYKTSTPTDPINYYGHTKAVGEAFVQKNNPTAIIVRTSWVYSVHGNNFVKTMLRLMRERTELKVVSDQIGSPTYAADLASALLKIIEQDIQGKHFSGIYHYSNTGVISWYDFAVAIRDLAGLHTKLYPIPTTDYPTPAKRPAYSVMDTSTFEKDFCIELHNWHSSLERCMKLIL